MPFLYGSPLVYLGRLRFIQVHFLQAVSGNLPDLEQTPFQGIRSSRQDPPFVIFVAHDEYQVLFEDVPGCGFIFGGEGDFDARVYLGQLGRQKSNFIDRCMKGADFEGSLLFLCEYFLHSDSVGAPLSLRADQIAVICP